MMYILLPSYEEIRENKQSYAKSFAIQYRNTDPFSGKRLVEPYGDASLCRAESTGKTADAGRRWMMSTRFHTCRTWHPMLRCSGRHSGDCRGKVQSGQQPGLLWRM